MQLVKPCLLVTALSFSIIDPVPFPEKLSNRYGLTIEVLSNAFSESSDAVQWSVSGIPDVGFYRMLHQFLDCDSETSIGKFYLAIDEQLQERRSSPYNTYRFIERLISSNIPDSENLNYSQ